MMMTVKKRTSFEAEHPARPGGQGTGTGIGTGTGTRRRKGKPASATQRAPR